MGILNSLFKGAMYMAEKSAERAAGVAHNSARSGSFQGHRLSEQQREHLRNKELEYREMAARAHAARMNNEEDD